MSRAIARRPLTALAPRLRRGNLAGRVGRLAALLDRALDEARVGGLDEVIVEAGAERAVAVLALPVARERDEERVAGIAALAQLARDGVAVEAGQADVEHDDVRRV